MESIIACPKCKRELSKQRNVLSCTSKHSFKIKKGVPITANLDDYQQIEAQAWEDEWSKNISPKAIRAYKANMKIFKKLGYWEEAAEAASFIDSDPNNVVLDLGCGNGVSTAYIKGKLKFGLDLSERQMVRAKEKYPKTNYVVGDARFLPFKSNTFDLVVAINLLHHIDDPQQVLNECYRVLKKRGKLITVDPNLYNPIGYTGRGLYRLLGLKRIFPSFPQFALGEDERQFSKSQYYSLFEQSKFKNYQIKPRRIERLLFFSTILLPTLMNVPFYPKFLELTSKYGDALVQVKPFDWICYFWIGNATK